MTAVRIAREDEIDAYCAEWLDLPLERVREPGTTVAPSAHIPLDRILLFARGETTIVRVHPERHALVAGLATPARALRAADLRAALGGAAGSDVPAEQLLYTDAASFRPAPPIATRELGPEDEAIWSELVSACTEREVELSEIELGQPFVLGGFEGERIVAASSYLRPGGVIADIGVLARPDARGKGYGAAVASAVARRAFDRGLIPQWWALVSNRPSVAIARRLGFVHYAFEEGGRLTPDRSVRL